MFKNRFVWARWEVVLIGIGLVCGSGQAATTISIGQRGKIGGMPVRAAVKFNNKGTPSFSFAAGKAPRRRRRVRQTVIVPVIL